MELTKQMFIYGSIDIEEVKMKDIRAFCEAEGFDVNCASARGKAKILNDITGCIENSEIPYSIASLETIETVTESAQAPEPVEEPKVRDNGEVIRLASDGKDYGANLLNRQK